MRQESVQGGGGGGGCLAQVAHELEVLHVQVITPVGAHHLRALPR